MAEVTHSTRRAVLAGAIAASFLAVSAKGLSAAVTERDRIEEFKGYCKRLSPRQLAALNAHLEQMLADGPDAEYRPLRLGPA